MLERTAYEVSPGRVTTVKDSVMAPDDGRQGSVAVAHTPDVVGTISPLPYPVGDEIRVTVQGDDCQM